MRLALALTLALCAGAASARPADCYLSVNGFDLINGPCDFEPIFGDGSFVITSPDGAFFAQVEVAGDGTAQGWWNGGANVPSLNDYIGTLYRSDACWVNDFASVCAW
jgi:hypothetical protein